MDGRQYNRAVRMHKLVYEAIIHLAWKEFIPWLEMAHPTDFANFEQAIKSFTTASTDVSEETFSSLLSNIIVTQTLNHFESFLNNLRDGSNGDLAVFWMSYVDMVDVMLGLLRASREGDWMLHMGSIRAIIPWAFAYDKINYARYLSIYYAEMTQLATSHPIAYNHFINGGFSVQRNSSNPFGKIPADQAIEETVNKDTQTPGGTKGFSLNPAAVKRYYMTAEYRSICLRQLRDMVHQTTSKVTHADLHGTRIQKDYSDIETLVDILEKGWINPMSGDQPDLVSISTGKLATQNIANDIKTAHEIGEKSYADFKKDRLESDPPAVNFHERIVKLGLKTFSALNKNKSVGKVLGKEVILQADKNLFSHMVLAAQSRNLDLQEVLSHPLGPMPWALATPDGSLRKTNKASLAKAVTQNVRVAETIPTPSACIIDGMALVQRLKGENQKISDIAQSVLSMALREGAPSQRIDIVFDVYRETSIKATERGNRGSNDGIQFKNIAGAHTIHQWRKFLCSPFNKSSLIKFLIDTWRKPEHRSQLGDKRVYVTCEDSCFKITKDASEEISELRSTQEEADTRLLLHAAHSAKDGFRAVIIMADDTDILVLALGFRHLIPCPLYQRVGTHNRQKYIDIDKVANNLGSKVCTALIGLHAFTGCDTVSAFAGKDKVCALKLMMKDNMYQQCFCELGDSWKISDDLFKRLMTFTCSMYISKKTLCDVNECRYKLFCAKRGDVTSTQLPPCSDCLYKHARRANYQARIWRQCLECDPSLPCPTENGWTIDNEGTLGIHWMSGSPAPSTVLELMKCNCTRSCSAKDCPCMVNGLNCTQMCRLQTCDNQLLESEQDTCSIIESDDESEGED